MLFTGTVQISREASLARFKLDPADNTTLVKHVICHLHKWGDEKCNAIVTALFMGFNYFLYRIVTAADNFWHFYCSV